MITNIFILFFAALLGGLATRYFDYSKTRIRYPLIFAGSFLFALTVIHILPEIFLFSGNDLSVSIWILLGFFFQQGLDQFTSGIEHGHFHKHSHGSAKPGLLIALIIHSILEGSLLTDDASFHQHHGTELLLFGIILHKIPAAFVLMTMLKQDQVNLKIQYLFLFLFSIASPIGFILSSQLSVLSPEHFVILFALVSGIFLHISTTIFVETNPEHRVGAIRWIIGLLGAGLAILSEYFL